MNKYILKMFLAVSAAVALFTSCNTEAEGVKYTAGTHNLSFYSNKAVWSVGEGSSELILPVYRGNGKGELTVKISLDDATAEEGLFSIASSEVTFNDGDNAADAVLVCNDSEALASDAKYTVKLTLEVDADALSPAGYSSITVTATR